MPITIVVRDDDVLQYSELGNVRELIPVRGTYFRMKDLRGAAVEFLRNAEGKWIAWQSTVPGAESLIVPRKK